MVFSRNNYEHLTHTQLQQRVMQLESELNRIKTDRGRKGRGHYDKFYMLQEDNRRLKAELQKAINDHFKLNQERGELINNYNKISLEKNTLKRKISQYEKGTYQTDLKSEIENLKTENSKFGKIASEARSELIQLKEGYKEAQGKVNLLNQEKNDLELQIKNLTNGNKKMRNDQQVLQKKVDLLEDNNISFLQKIAELEKDKNNALEAASHLETELLDFKAKLSELEQLKTQLLKQAKNVSHLEDEKQSLFKEKTELLHKVAKLEEEVSKIEILEREKDMLTNKAEEVKSQFIRLRDESQDTQNKLSQLVKENDEFGNEIKIKDEAIQNLTDQNEKLGRELKLKEEQLDKNNVSYLQKITQLETDKTAAHESASRLKAELLDVQVKLNEMDQLKMNLSKGLENRDQEVCRLEEENQSLIAEKIELLDQVAKLEEENVSFHGALSKLSSQRRNDEERLDKITSNLNEVFAETKQLVRMTSSLKHQLDAKSIELNQMKKEKEMLMQEIVQLKEDYEKSEARKNELENQIDIMKSELLKAQNSLSRLEQFEVEKLKMKEDLELRIEDFNKLTDHYQMEKESYLNLLGHVQDQVNIYKEKSELFDSEKGSWSKQIDELKSELAQTKATIVKMQELEQKNEKFAEELRLKEMELYKVKVENERALAQQLEQFKAEIKQYQVKITQYEKDREMWENRMKQMNAQFAGLESSLEEKENFIKQYIQQPLPQSISPIPNPSQQVIAQSEQATPMQKSPAQQQGEWFQRVMYQQQGMIQQVPKSQREQSASVDFFTLRRKTTQPSNSGPNWPTTN